MTDAFGTACGYNLHRLYMLVSRRVKCKIMKKKHISEEENIIL